MMSHTRWWSLLVAVGAAILAVSEPGEGQPVPDETLGGERSTVTEGVIRGVPSDRIGGGATRGQNLFHSFESFDIEAGRGAYFDNPAGIVNIFSRVTGSTPSAINGRLGVIQAGSTDILGTANLFFMNPNGILFGPTASLDVGGSFVGTTANAIGFGEAGFFSAADRTAPPLLEVNPSAFLFSQINAAPIQAFGTPPGTGATTTTLQVLLGQSLVLLGGDVSLNATNILAPGGRVELGGLQGEGTIGLTSVGDVLELEFPNQAARADVLITNRSGIAVIFNSRGSIRINADNITFSENSNAFAGGFSLLGSATDLAGNIYVNATGALTLFTSFIGNTAGISNSGSINISAQAVNLSNGSSIASVGIGQSEIGNVTIEADTISLSGRNEGGASSRIISSISSSPEFTGVGRGGDVRLQARQISLADGAFVGTTNALVNESTAEGTVGNIIVSATESLTMIGGSGFRTNTSGQANAGNISIATEGTVSLLSGSGLVSFTAGQGNAGSVAIQADGNVLLDGVDAGGNRSLVSSSVFGAVGVTGTREAGVITIDTDGSLVISNGALIQSNVETGAIGQAGNINIFADSLNLSNGGQIQSSLRDTNTADNILGGQGRAGLIRLDIQNATTLSGRNANGAPTGIFSSVDLGANGQGGGIDIETDSLSLLDGSVLEASTYGIGNAGDLTIRSKQVLVQDGAQMLASTYGIGNAGNLTVRASDRIEIDGASATDTGLFTQVGGRVRGPGEGNVGNLIIDTNQLVLRNGGQVNATIFGTGRGGSLTIHASDIQLSGTTSIPGRTGVQPSAIQTRIEPGGRGQSPNLTIVTDQMSVRGGARVAADVEQGGQGQGGNVLIQAGDSVEIVGISTTTGLISQLTASLNQGAVGNAGNLTIETDRLVVQGGEISATTTGQGNAGSLTLNASDSIILSDIPASRGFIRAIVGRGAIGQGGSVSIDTTRLVLQGGVIAASTLGQGNAGDLGINASDSIILIGEAPATESSPAMAGGLFSRVRPTASGDGGNIRITTGRLDIQDGSQLQVTTLGNGDAGSLFILADEINVLDTSSPNDSPTGIFAGVQVESGSNVLPEGNGGDLTIRTNRLNLQRSEISASVDQGAIGNGGDIDIYTDSLQLTDRAQISAATDGTGRAGSIDIQGIAANSPANSVVIDNSTISTAIQENGAVNIADPDRSNINIQTRSLDLSNGADITASTSNQGNAGNITVLGANTINLNNSTITSTVNSGATGDGGSITLNAGSLNLNQGSVTASTSGNGRAGDVTISNAEQVTLDRSTISTAVGETGVGQGGDIRVQTGQLNLQNQSDITSSTANLGNTGSITITATDNLNLGNSSITSEVRGGATGDSQNITIATPNLTLRNSSTISAATDGTGQAGDIQIQEADRISLSDSIISTEVQANATVPEDTDDRQGNITVDTRSLSLNDAAITASTAGAGRAGDITVTAETLEADNGGRLVTSTRSDRSAGTIRVDATEQIQLDGSGSGIFANTETNSTGNGGSINLSTTNLQLSDRARISAQSRGRGAAGGVSIQASGNVSLSDRARISTESVGENAAAGNIRITAGDRFAATDSDVTTAAARASGGDIAIRAGDIRLFGDSDIRTDSAQDGGNITLDADTIIAFADSDLFASAAAGRGGNIVLNTPAFFGSGYDPEASQSGNISELEDNDRVDLNATGSVSSGTITTPDTSFVQNSLADLSEAVVDADRLIANSCIARTETGGTFLITGAGGLPPRPGVAPLSPYPTGTVQTGAEGESSWQPGEAIVEPQGLYELANGQLVMSRECD